MKNIHVLPTDKPSNLLLCIKDYTEHIDTPAENSDIKGNFKLGFGIYANTEFYKYQNIYITSNEEIKEGDWFMFIGVNGNSQPYKFGEIKSSPIARKIILTTDQDLIKDGVQAINDEFSEWFVKNPSCKEVEIKYGCQEDQHWNWALVGRPCTCKKITPRIVLPKEESKQVGQITEKGIIDTIGTCANCGVEFHIHKESEESKQEQGCPFDEPLKYSFKHEAKVLTTEEVMKERSSAYEFIDFDKQETLEEAANNYSSNKLSKLGFISGYKLAQERSYSKEEVKQILLKSIGQRTLLNDIGIPEWFEQFKKK